MDLVAFRVAGGADIDGRLVFRLRGGAAGGGLVGLRRVEVDTVDRHFVHLSPIESDFRADTAADTPGRGALICENVDDQMRLSVVLSSVDKERSGVIADLIEGEEVLSAVEHCKKDRRRRPKSPITFTHMSVDGDSKADANKQQPVDDRGQEETDGPGEDRVFDDRVEDAAEHHRVDANMEEERKEPPANNIEKSDRQKRLFELRLQLNQARALNKKQSEEERERLSESKAEQRKRLAKQEREAKARAKAERDPDAELLHQTAEKCQESYERKHNKKPAAFGWDVFNQDALFRSYERRTKSIPRQIDESKDAVDEFDPLSYGHGAKPSPANVDAMVNELNETVERRSKFSRRRQFYEDETVSYINERNRVFNKKVARFFDPYTQELKASLERGTG
ncbi:Pre-mRNA-splicing factor SYF2 [Plasmodiophora brassicae]|uniref:Pre-mRNA-splicing factor SYF2 n=1 Tax=Plasmodiophora brassicae TaxID=37360 RepID=A0A3P3Y0G5_PLABS|nr:unnamed protein product [Plasmodiophora brassicae]